ncbi:methyl-accepting chemotaxis protein [Anaerosinus massiliensis]|uniref:methyl-accepting chemotaxis protein n=1 Tax=Massilibacillus massiliensis TaxID=1806837 RepID=UPI000DA6168C|nr:methyl-accepting chemotaxis protein [Massilibacillus massiliensis]
MRKSLKTKLVVLFILFAFIPVVIGTALNAYFNIVEMRQSAVSANLNLSKEISHRIKSLLDNAQSINESLAAVPSVRSMDAETMKVFLIEVQKKNPQFELIAVLDKDGQQIARTSGKNSNRADRDYFKEARNGKVFFSDAYISATTKALCATVSAPILGADGSVVGVIASDVSMQSLWEIAEANVIGKTGYIDIVDNKGTIIAHPDKEKVFAKENFSKYEYVTKAIGGQGGSMDAESSTGEDSLIVYTPVEKYNWAVVAYEPTNEVYAAVIQNSLVMSIIVVLSILISGFVALRLANSIVNPIKILIEGAQKISKGNLSSKIVVDGALEINLLAKEFNAMIEHLRNLIMKTTEASETVSAASEQLAASIDAVGQSSQEVATTVQKVAEGTNEQVRLSEESVTVIHHMMQSIDHAATAAEDAAKVTDDSKVSAHKGTKQSEDAIIKISDVQQGVKDSAEVINLLGEKSRQIGTIVDTITGLAGQTNLLALNAAIEAARAGEHGRGFAVVAEEVSKLAEQSERAAGEIAEIISSIRQETLIAVESMDRGRKNVDDGVVAVENTGASFDAIYDEISTASAQVDRILTITQKQKESSYHMKEAVEKIADFAKVNANGAEKVSAASEEQSAAVQEIKSAADDLARMAIELRGEISKFSV